MEGGEWRMEGGVEGWKCERCVGKEKRKTLGYRVSNTFIIV